MTRVAGLTRRDLLRGGGGLLVALPLGAALGATPAGNATGAAAPTGVAAAAGATAVAGPPDARQVDSWLAIHADDTATLYIGFAELGQGATTALAQVAAEELDLDPARLRVAPLDTQRSPNQGGTYSSAAVQRGRPQVAAAAAEARRALLKLAAARLGQDVAALDIEDGRVFVVADPARGVRYGELLGAKRFELAISGDAPLKPVDRYRLVGRALPRADLRARVDGTKRYIQQMKLPGMLHARVLRPPGQAAYGHGAPVLAVDSAALAGIPGARLLRQADFLAVVAPREWDAIRAARAVRVTWADPPPLPAGDALFTAMRAGPADEQVVLQKGDTDGAFAAAAQVASQRVHGPYQAHAPFAPNCALADIREGGGLVICSSQDIYNARRGIAALLKVAPEALRVQFAEGAGTYGHSGYDDVAQAAALASRLAGAPVRLQFQRGDEQAWDTFGPAHVGEVRIAADAAGRITGYEYHGWQHNWSLVETTAQLAGAQAATMWPRSNAQGVNALCCGGMYDIAHRRLVNHWLDGLAYLKGAWLRSPLDLSLAFASEQAVDRLAFQLGRDPVEFRRANIVDDRWRGVLDAAAAAARWEPRPARSRPRSDGDWHHGRGVGLGTHLISHGAAVADVAVNVATGDVRITQLYGAIDAGAVVNPGIVEAQVMGQLVQAASRLLHEGVTIDATGRVAGRDWATYPILRFAGCPAVTPIVVQRLDQRSTGAGEETMAAAAAAIANAFFDATGVRAMAYPLTAARVRDLLRT